MLLLVIILKIYLATRTATVSSLLSYAYKTFIWLSWNFHSTSQHSAQFGKIRVLLTYTTVLAKYVSQLIYIKEIDQMGQNLPCLVVHAVLCHQLLLCPLGWWGALTAVRNVVWTAHGAPPLHGQGRQTSSHPAVYRFPWLALYKYRQRFIINFTINSFTTGNLYSWLLTVLHNRCTYPWHQEQGSCNPGVPQNIGSQGWIALGA